MSKPNAANIPAPTNNDFSDAELMQLLVTDKGSEDPTIATIIDNLIRMIKLSGGKFQQKVVVAAICSKRNAKEGTPEALDIHAKVKKVIQNRVKSNILGTGDASGFGIPKGPGIAKAGQVQEEDEQKTGT